MCQFTKNQKQISMRVNSSPILVKITVEMCQFTEISMTRFKVSFMLHNFSQRRKTTPRPTLCKIDTLQL